MSKYVNPKNNIVHCPSCRGVILRDVEFENPENVVSLKARCPHCEKDADVTINVASGEITINDGD